MIRTRNSLIADVEKVLGVWPDQTRMSAFSQGPVQSKAPATANSWRPREGRGPRGTVSGKPRTVHQAPGKAPPEHRSAGEAHAGAEATASRAEI